ncbi:MAG: 3-oxoacyl-[acyl-carrier-protein] reductase [Epulopiscium sp.]|nr:3-oxoacyl-[acyl-carrier-protein] reductase [Candidatus Epulonipiscium sp.]
MLKGKVALVTGASRGIGKSVALALAKEGAMVAVNYYKDEKGAETVAREIVKKGGQALVVQGNVSIKEEAKKLIDATVEHWGRIDILVNNAGITKDGLLLKMKEEDFDSVLATNLKGTFHCLQEASKVMLKQRAGKIINISSVVGVIGNMGQTNYAAAKAGVIGLTKSAAKELAIRGITVNAIAPGFIETDMTETLSDKIKDQLLSNIPLRRLGKPEEVANLVCFLASQRADYITGQVLHVDGGLVMA